MKSEILKALIESALKFEEYADIHTKKKTIEGSKKALKNKVMEAHTWINEIGCTCPHCNQVEYIDHTQQGEVVFCYYCGKEYKVKVVEGVKW